MKCHACGFIGDTSGKDGTGYDEYFHTIEYAYRGNSSHPGLVYDGTFYSCPKCGTHKSYVVSDSLKINGGSMDSV